jgi:hypothetical protein
MRTVIVLLGVIALAATIALLAAIPAVIGFGLVGILATSWCVWLERHPEESG